MIINKNHFAYWKNVGTQMQKATTQSKSHNTTDVDNEILNIIAHRLLCRLLIHIEKK